MIVVDHVARVDRRELDGHRRPRPAAEAAAATAEPAAAHTAAAAAALLRACSRCTVGLRGRAGRAIADEVIHRSSAARRRASSRMIPYLRIMNTGNLS